MQRQAWTKRPSQAAALAFVVATLGCTVEPSSYESDADVGSTHALISIERTAQASELQVTRAEAFAGILQTPPEVDPAVVLKLTGLARELPGEASCSSGRERNSSVPLAPLKKVELLDAGDLAINAGIPTTLAPRAFPTVTDLVSGVVYTTRDREADKLPPATTYYVTASGGSFGPFSAQADAPAELESVRIDGVPLAEVATLSSRSSLAVTWAPGEARDIVYIELTDASGQPALLCAFRDEAGSAVIPSGLSPSAGHGAIGVHRLRMVPFSADGLARGELRFDFELESEVEFAD